MTKMLGLFLALFGNEPPFPHAVLARYLAFLDERPRKPSSAQDGDLVCVCVCVGGGGRLPCIFAPSEAGLPLLYLAYSTGKQVAALGIPMSTLAVNSTSF